MTPRLKYGLKYVKAPSLKFRVAEYVTGSMAAILSCIADISVGKFIVWKFYYG